MINKDVWDNEKQNIVLNCLIIKKLIIFFMLLSYVRKKGFDKWCNEVITFTLHLKMHFQEVFKHIRSFFL